MKKVALNFDVLAPAVILVRPQISENIGMTARAMMNTALSELRLVAPRESHLSEKALAASSGAAALLESAKVFSTLEEALADCHFVLATSSRSRDMTKPVLGPQEAARLLLEHASKGLKTALLFGAERTGLQNEELMDADAIIEIPLNPKHASLNLAQAVLLMGYTFFQNRFAKNPNHFETGASQMANKKEVALFLEHLEDTLTKRGYFRFPEKKERMRRNLRNIFTRNHLTHAEIKTLYGVITDLTRPPLKEEI